MSAKATLVDAVARRRIAEDLDATFVVGQACSAVHARVVQGADLTVLATDDDERFIGHVVDDVRSGLHDFVFEAGELPRLHPDVFLLESGELRRREA